MPWRILTVLAFLFAAFVIAAVGLQTPAGMVIKTIIGYIPFGDKTLHLLLTVGLSFLLNAALQGRQVALGRRKILLGSLLVGMAITLEECSQAFIPSRNFELLDMMFNFAGIYSGSTLLAFFPSLQTQNEHADRRKTISLQAIFHRTRPLRHESGHGRRPVGRVG